MADFDLQGTISLDDNATRQLQNFQKQAKRTSRNVKSSFSNMRDFAERNKETFRNMAIGWAAALGGIAFGANKAVDAAAKAEGAWNKFGTVFEDQSESMRAWTKEIRSRMPEARSQIARMAADTQDLLKPMGLANDEAADMTKQTVELANKVAAFNDVNPRKVLEAMKSGFTGISKPLKKFGINANQSALNAKALEMWLLDAGQKLSELKWDVKNQVRAQALLQQAYDQSADAISGFEKNQDSYLRRSQAFKAGLKEIKTVIGQALLPVFDRLVKKMLPVLKTTRDWIKTNPKVATTIIWVATAVAWLTTAIGVLGISIWPIMTGLSAIGTALSSIPFWGVVWAVTWLAAAWKTNFLNIRWYTKQAWKIIKNNFSKIVSWGRKNIPKMLSYLKQQLSKFVQYLKDNFGSQFKSAFKSLVSIIKNVGGLLKKSFKWWKLIIESLAYVWNNNIYNIKDIVKTAFDGIVGIITWVFKTMISKVKIKLNAIKTFFKTTMQLLKGDWEGAWDTIKTFAIDTMNTVKERIKQPINFIKDSISDLENSLSWLPSKVSNMTSSAVDKAQWAWWATKNFVSWFRANGWPVSRNKAYVVGEQWPELFVPKQSGSIVPNGQARGGNKNITINMWGVTVKNEADENRLLNKVKNMIRNEQRYSNLGFN